MLTCTSIQKAAMVKMNMLSKLKTGKSKSSSGSKSSLDEATHLSSSSNSRSSRRGSSKDVKMTDASSNASVDVSNRSGGSSKMMSSSKTGPSSSKTSTSSRSRSGASFQFLYLNWKIACITSPYHRIHLIFARYLGFAESTRSIQIYIPPAHTSPEINLFSAPHSIHETPLLERQA